MKKTARLFVILLVLFSTKAIAAEDNLMQDVFILDPVKVSEGLHTEKLDRSSAIVVEKNRSNNIADFLVRDPEISFKRKAAFGDSSDIISIRGFESKRIMLNLDGRNISSTGNVGGSYIDFGTIPLDNIERIEVIKGGSSVEYGNAALGGVINAYTRKPKEDPYLSLYATAGGWKDGDGYDFHNIRGSYSQKFNALGLSLGISHQKAQPFLRNNHYESFHANPKFFLELPWDGELILGYNYSHTERGLIRSNRDDGVPNNDTDPSRPGFSSSIDKSYPVASGEYFAGGAPTPSMNVIGSGAHWKKERHIFDVSYRQELGDTAFVEGMFFKNYETRREKNYADVAARQQVSGPPMHKFDPTKTKNGDLVLDRKVTMDQSYGYKLKSGVTLGNHEFLGGFDYKVLKSGGITVEYVDKNYNKAGPNGWTGNMNSSGAGSPAKVYGAFVSDKYSVTDKLTLDMGLRFDSYKYRSDGLRKELKDHKLSPKLTASYVFDDNHSASVAVYQNYRTPTMPELHWGSEASSDDDNKNVPYLKGKRLKPETARGIDLAYKYSFDEGGFIKASAFYYDIKDYIVHKPVYVNRPSGQAWSAYNVDAKIYGATLSGVYPLLDNLRIDGAVTWQDNEKKNDPSDPSGVMKRLEYIPNWKAVAGVSWDICDDLTLDADLTYVSERKYYINTASLKKGTLGAYATLGGSLRYKLDDHTTVEVYADNITDSRYQESWGYPAMGFNMGMSLKWEL